MALLICSSIWFLFAAHFLFAMTALYLNRQQLTPDVDGETGEWPFVSVVVPARNEAANIRRCLSSLLAQSYPAERLKIIAVDDDSEDSTAAIIAELQVNSPRLQARQARPLAEGWTGKNNACASGAAEAEGEWICFIDADTGAEPELLKASIALARREHVDLLSLNPFQETVSTAERVWLPGVFAAIARSMNFRGVNDPHSPEALANGQFMLFRRSTYEALGGHQAVAGDIMDDMALARLIKKNGKRLYWAFGDQLMRTRMYRSFAEIWGGFGKNMSDIIAHQSATIAILAALRSLLIAWVPPIILATAAWQFAHTGAPMDRVSLILASVAFAGLYIFFIMMIHALRVPFRYVACMPLGFSLHALLVVVSLGKKHNKTRQWKGRAVP